MIVTTDMALGFAAGVIACALAWLAFYISGLRNERSLFAMSAARHEVEINQIQKGMADLNMRIGDVEDYVRRDEFDEGEADESGDWLSALQRAFSTEKQQTEEEKK